MELGAEPVDENACGIEDEDDEFEGGVDFSVGGAEECDVGGLDRIADAVAAEGAVHLSVRMFPGAGVSSVWVEGPTGRTATFMMISLGVGEPRIMATRIA